MPLVVVALLPRVEHYDQQWQETANKSENPGKARATGRIDRHSTEQISELTCTAGLELPYSAVVAKLDPEPAEGGGFGKHFCLNMTGVVRGRFATRHCIRRENQSSALAGRFVNR